MRREDKILTDNILVFLPDRGNPDGQSFKGKNREVGC